MVKGRMDKTSGLWRWNCSRPRYCGKSSLLV